MNRVTSWLRISLLPWLPAMAVLWYCCTHRSPRDGVTWKLFFLPGAHALFGTPGLHTYARNPLLQIGPLSLVVAEALDTVGRQHGKLVAQLFTLSLLIVVGWGLRKALPGRPFAFAVGAASLAYYWSDLSWQWLHLDDALAVMLLSMALVSARRDRAVLTGVLIASAANAKPWAVFGVALIFLLSRRRRLSLVAMVVGIATCWLPFLVADPGTLATFHPPLAVENRSALWLLGLLGKPLPGWVRPAQLLGGSAIAVVAAIRGRWPLALLAGFAVRLLLEPMHNPYFTASAVAFALIADLGDRRRFPWLTVLTAVVWWQPNLPTEPFSAGSPVFQFFVNHDPTIAGIRIGWCLLMILLALLPRISFRGLFSLGEPRGIQHKGP